MEIRNTHDRLDASDARLPGARFYDVDLSVALFSDLNLSGARFENVNLTEVTIDDANLGCMTIRGILVTDLLVAYGAGHG